MKKKIDLPQVSEVVLPEVFHLRPGVYIFILLLVLLILALFFITIFPGIIKGGRYVTFEAPLAESGITIDDTYLGGSDHQYFVKSGTYQVTYTKAGIPYAQQEVTIDHPLFLTHFIHRTKTVTEPAIVLDAEQAGAIIRFDLTEIADASAILEWNLVNRYAPLYKNLAQDLAALSYPDSEGATLLALSYITTEAMFNDAMHAFGASSSNQIRAALERIAPLFSERGDQSGEVFEQQDVNTTKGRVLTSSLFSIEGTRYEPAAVALGAAVPLRYPSVREMPIQEHIEQPFVLANLPVSIYQWAHFLEANPEWKSSNRDNLIAQELVDPFYLKGVVPSTLFVTRRPITNISYHSAQAFCAWLSEVSGKEVFLPTEAMYTLAASSHPQLVFTPSLAATAGDGMAPSGLFGGVWEMTQSPFIPLSRLLGSEEVRTLHRDFGLRTDPIVKGGSYLNDPAQLSEHSVGVISPDACADQIGLRIAWYE